MAKTKERGGSVEVGPMDIPGVGRMAVCKDPTGAVFSLFKGTEHQSSAPLGPRHGNFCWREPKLLWTRKPRWA